MAHDDEWMGGIFQLGGVCAHVETMPWKVMIHSLILLPYSLSGSTNSSVCDFVCAMVVHSGTCTACTATSWMKIYHCMYKYTLKHVYIYISDNIWYIWKYVCMVLTYIALYWHELQISMEHRIHRCIAFASAFWCATPVLKSRVNSLPQSSQSDTNCHGGFIHSDFNKGNKHKTMQNDTKPLQSTLISLILWTRFIRPVSGSTTGPPLFPALEGSIFRTEICVQQQLWGNYIDGCIHCQGQAWDASTEMK